ncbi:MAG: hypothetical protein ACNA7O_07140 [Rhodobacterales bacterium]
MKTISYSIAASTRNIISPSRKIITACRRKRFVLQSAPQYRAKSGKGLSAPARQVYMQSPKQFPSQR